MKPAGANRWVVGFVACAVLASLVMPAVARGQMRKHAEGISRPSEEAKLSFQTPGVVSEAPVKDGELIKAGQVLLVQEDSIDKKELERLELEANSKARVEAAEADLKVKQAVLKRMTGAGPDAYNIAEIEEAENNVLLREKQLVVAREEHQQAKLKAEQQARKLELMRLKSHFDGAVQQIVVKVGEWADPQSREGAVIVVKNDPMHIEVRELTTRQVAMLTMNQKLKVRHADDPDKPENWQEAEIFYFSPVADAGSGTRLIKLRMPNPTNRATGLAMIVQLPDEVAAAGTMGADLAGAGR
jgi:multidrug efflux pump subunit AcrA (membrane-fusion protein)